MNSSVEVDQSPVCLPKVVLKGILRAWSKMKALGYTFRDKERIEILHVDSPHPHSLEKFYPLLILKGTS